MTRPRVFVSSARTLVALTAAIVVSFLVATILAQYRAAAIEARVTDLVGNAMPSVQTLSFARSDLRREMTLLSRIVRHPAADFSLAQREATADRLERESAFKSYLSLPFFPTERDQAAAVENQGRPYDSAVQDLFQALGHEKTARVSAAFDMVEQTGLLLDDGLQRLVEFNATQGQRLGLEITRIRTQSLALVIVLEMIAIALSVVAAFLSVRVMRSSVSILESRAAELELFSARVAHDLKGPLGGILLAASAADRARSPEKLLEICTQIRKVAERMGRIVDGLFEFARSGAHPSQRVAAELGRAIDDTVAAVRSEALQAEAILEVGFFERPVWVACSSGALASILGNLVRNAIKFIGENGRPERRITIRVNGTSHRVRVEVEDTGPGIPRDKLDSVFAPYIRANQSQSGLGLGLATVKRLVDGHSGKVGVESTLNQGSTFWFELSRAAAEGSLEKAPEN